VYDYIERDVIEWLSDDADLSVDVPDLHAETRLSGRIRRWTGPRLRGHAFAPWVPQAQCEEDALVGGLVSEALDITVQRDLGKQFCRPDIPYRHDAPDNLEHPLPVLEENYPGAPVHPLVLLLVHNGGEGYVPYSGHVVVDGELMVHPQALQRGRTQARSVRSAVIDEDGSPTSQGGYDGQPKTPRCGKGVDSVAGLRTG
jgi:hypothetical protein